ncbi:MAG: 4Fe-4S dicluster domain-containing protein [Blastocatellia bacterium]|nr:4Fe-4S dicluster domain-containing protein [Blastocatellia bacterium]
MKPQNEKSAIIERADFQALLDALIDRGYRVVGPTLSEGAIVYDELTAASDLPIGWTDEQEAGFYRIKKRDDSSLFGYTVGPHSWKKFLHPPVLRLWQARREGNGFQIIAEQEEPQKFAFIGVRSCELHAIAIQDKVFTGGNYVDPYYKSHRDRLFIVAINCGEAGNTCFCVSMNTGPKASFGFDLALTEILEDGRHYFVVEAGTEAGREVLQEIEHRTASDEEIEAAERRVENAATQMGRNMDTSGIKELLYRNHENPRWTEVASRCLTCANCTLVCPTCFCSTVEDTTDLTGDHAERWRKWDSCFTMDFSYIHGGSVRSSSKSRYRQWMTHKLASWIDQFDSSGCVGCGRCITWCPVGIDITEEVRAIRESENE